MTVPFSAKVAVDISWSRFLIKTVSNAAEREAALRLRHQVFMRELLGRDTENLLDQDAFDDICDHLAIIEQATGTMVGTYRFISSDFCQDFYTQTEFNLDDLLGQEGRKLEVGRACIHPDFRNGFTFIALWKGLSAYIHQHPVHYLFGCSSVKHTEAEDLAKMVDYLQRHGYYSKDYRCQPLPAFTTPGLDEALQQLTQQPLQQREGEDHLVKKTLPPLLWAYLDAGAKVAGMPALDRDFACADFLTILDTDNLRDDLVRKYKPW
ncbi:MAG: GNAT family N-acetyltransferase [Planctomycetota bacterium]|nr:MAG: GNAT family N-acetyltransferase [Planctomycetota bacterium]